MKAAKKKEKGGGEGRWTGRVERERELAADATPGPSGGRRVEEDGAGGPGEPSS